MAALRLPPALFNSFHTSERIRPYVVKLNESLAPRSASNVAPGHEKRPSTGKYITWQFLRVLPGLSGRNVSVARLIDRFTLNVAYYWQLKLLGLQRDEAGR